MRHDIVEYFASRSRADRIQAANFALLEELQQNLRYEPDMAGWTQIGGERTALPTDLLPEREEEIRRQSLLAYYRQPHGRGAIRTLVDFTIGGKGATVDFHEDNKDGLKAIVQWWRKFRRINKFFSFQVEMARRAHRDGGYIIQKFTQDDTPPKIRFRDIDALGTPDHPDGIETNPKDVETFVAFHFKTKEGTERVDAKDIIYYRNDVDRNVKKGRVTLESGLPLITMHRKWLDARLALNLVRSSVAIVQEVQGSSSDLLRLRNAQISSKRSDRETDKSKMLRPATILRGLPGVKYSMLSPNLDARDAAEDGRHILTSLGVGTGLPDMIVTGDFCHSMDTQVLTEQGWLNFADIQPDDRLGTMHPETGALEFQTPSRLNRFHYCGDMYRFLGRHMNFCVTEQHELLVSDYHAGYKGKESLRLNERPLTAYRKVRVSELDKTLYSIPASATWKGKDEPLFTLPDGTSIETDLWLEFLGYVITDGCATESLKTAVQITQKNPEKIQIIEQCLTELPWRYTKRVFNTDGCTVFRIFHPGLREFVAHLIGTADGVKSRQKHLPGFIWDLSPTHLQYLLDALVLGDGNIYPYQHGRARMMYRTTSPRLVDEVQRLALMIGYAAVVGDSTTTSEWGTCTTHWVSISDGHAQLLDTKRIERLSWNDDVWCATVPNGLLITRLNGKPFISGNSKSNFASSVVAQNPLIRRVEVEQGLIIEVDEDLVLWVLQDGLEKGAIPSTVIDQETGEERPIDLDFDIVFSPIIKRDFGQDTNGYVNLRNMRTVSRRTVQLQMGFDPDREDEFIRREEEMAPPDNDGQDDGDDNTVGNPNVPADRKRNNGRLLAPKDPSERRPRQNAG